MKLLQLGKVIITILLILFLDSCAAIIGGRSNSLVFKGDTNTGTTIYIDDSLVGEAKDKIVLSKGVIQHGSKMEIRADGYQTQEYLILLKPNTGYVVADFVIGVFPLIVDFATGDILRPSPRKFDLQLQKID